MGGGYFDIEELMTPCLVLAWVVGWGEERYFDVEGLMPTYLDQAEVGEGRYFDVEGLITTYLVLSRASVDQQMD